MLSLHGKREKREAVIRSSLIERLKNSIQSLIYGPGGENVPRLSSNSAQAQVLGHTDNTNALCSILEAIFIHGLKDSLGERLSSMLLGDLDRMPVPNFWLVVMIISHRDLIEEVSSLSFIMTDVGKGRAWLRLTLNQGQLISYLSVLASDAETLKEYYRPTAFLRDLESCDIMLRIIQPLIGISFNLATNAAILNTWTQTPLILSGTWVPAKYDQSLEPVMSATDVASTFLHDRCSGGGVSIPQTPLSDQMFDLILGSTPETRFILNSTETVSANETGIEHQQMEQTALPESDSRPQRPPTLPLHSSVENSNIPQSSPKEGCKADATEEAHRLPQSSDQSQCQQDQPEDSQAPQRISWRTASTSDSILNRSISLVSETNDYRNLLGEWPASETPVDNLPDFLTFDLNQPSPTGRDALQPQEVPEEEQDFEIMPLQLISEEMMSAFLPMLTVLMNEKGLDSQNYHCYSPNCSTPIGIIHGKPRVCKYDGKYYCHECHQGDKSIIPARVLHNWDFSTHPVSVSNKRWLDTVMQHPLLDIRLANPKLYCIIEDLAELQMLRLQLHFIQAYLFTCTSDGGHNLRKMFWPREYLYEHVHLYSTHDLKQVSEGKLVHLARRAVTTGRQHILNCRLCFPRGFICEVCKDSNIIYPFQLGDTFPCGACSGVFHKNCVTSQSDCPKCKRISSRSGRNVISTNNSPNLDDF